MRDLIWGGTTYQPQYDLFRKGHFWAKYGVSVYLIKYNRLEILDIDKKKSDSVKEPLLLFLLPSC